MSYVGGQTGIMYRKFQIILIKHKSKQAVFLSDSLLANTLIHNLIFCYTIDW